MYKIQGIIFDLDGVITDTAEYHYLAWKKIADKLGIIINREFNEQLKGVSRTESLEKILKFGGKENSFSKEQKQELANQKNEEYRRMIQQITSEQILPGVVSFLDELNENKIKSGIASVSKNAETILTALGIKERFDFIVDAVTVKRSKPDPEVFIKAIKGLQLSPDVCVGIEDAALGIDAIHASGMKAIGIGSKKILDRADLVLQDTSQLSLKQLSKLV